MISRLTSLPPTTTFEKLHQAIEVSFGWTDSHIHQFMVREIKPLKYTMGRTLLTLKGEDSLDTSFTEDTMDPDEEFKAETTISLADVFEDEQYKSNTRMSYEHDTGDSWERDVFLLGRADATLGSRMGFKQEVLYVAREGHGWAELKTVVARWGGKT